MFSKLILLTVFLVEVNCRHILLGGYGNPVYFIEVGNNLAGNDDYNGDVQPYHGPRVRRDQSSVSINSDGIVDTYLKRPIAGNSENVLSATASQSSTNAHGAGLTLDNVNGNSFSFSGKQIPDFGTQLTAAGKTNLYHSDKHDFNANAFITRNLPDHSDIPNFNTYGGGLDYTYNNKVGASLNAAHTDLLQRTDVSALGNLNLYRDPSHSFDFSGGARRSFSPFIPKSSWEPTFGFTFTKSW